MSGMEVSGIKWRISQHRFPNYKAAIIKDPCVYCLEKSSSWEHIQPRSLGGYDGWYNIARACLDCNRQRDVTPFLIYMLREFNAKQSFSSSVLDE